MKQAPSQDPPADVAFHVMPGAYQGVAAKRMAPPLPTAPVSMPSASQPSPKKFFIIWGVIAVVVLGGGGGMAFLVTSNSVPRVPAASSPEVTPSVAPEPVASPSPQPEPVSPEEATVPEQSPVTSSSSPVPLFSSPDADQDSLTDIEEALYGTDSAIADTDKDGYLDGQEVEHLYNPAGTAPVRIADSSLVKHYINATVGYALLYPAGWSVRALDEANPREVLFTSATGEFIQVLVDDNPEVLSASAWYAKQFPAAEPQNAERFFIDNLEGVWTSDKTTAYVTTSAVSAKRPVFGITYNVGERTDVHFRTTLKMMVNSFRVE